MLDECFGFGCCVECFVSVWCGDDGGFARGDGGVGEYVRGAR